jgi:hypothetical protein
MSQVAVSCDEVFEVLTSGPFPRDASPGFSPLHVADAAIELHLVACHDCRLLAEALRPAVRLIEDATLEEDDQLPAYRGSLPFPGNWSAPGKGVSRSLQTASRAGAWRVESGRKVASAYKFAAALALAFLLFALFQFGNERDRQPREVGGRNSAPSAEGVRRLSALGLPMACLAPVGESTTSPAGATPIAHGGSNSSARFACCTGCHSQANPARPQVDAIAVLVSSCLACHERP